MGYGLAGGGLIDLEPTFVRRNNGRSSSDDELHNDITTTYSCCQ